MTHSSDTIKNLPRFSETNFENIDKTLTEKLAVNLKTINTLLKENQPYTWDNLMRPLEDLEDDLHKTWGPISHMNAVVNSDPLRKAYNECLPKLSDYDTKLSHNKALYDAIHFIYQDKSFNALDRAQKKVIENTLRDFKLAGVTLSDNEKKQFGELKKELSLLTTKFEENVLDARKAWQKHITDIKELSGLPEHIIQSAEKAAENENKSGWILTLDIPVYIAVMTQANSGTLRKEMYYAYTTLASDQGPHAGKWDNSKIMIDILKKRHALSKLLNFSNYAEYSLATKMIKDPNKVLEFLYQLVDASLKKAKKEYSELCEFAKKEFHVDRLNAWDIAYYSEKLLQHQYAISQEMLRPYFPEYKVIDGLFSIVKQLFNIDIKALQEVDTWHKDVRCYAVYDKNGKLISQFFLDLYARKNKRSGAWMDECLVRRQLNNGNIQIPSAYIICNFNAPVGNDPALFTHDEVITLFHEFGHSLQHMLTTVNYSDVSGINGIPWDAVEIASQLMENWAWEHETIPLISEHYQSQQALPKDMLDKMRQAKNFHSAMQMMRQLEFALFDFRLHMEFDPAEDNQIQRILNEVREKVSVISTPAFNRFAHSFSHIFAGGYAAGYYSYKWAEVMAADAFSLFQEKGIFNPNVSQKLLTTFLQSGGAVEPADLFIQFRGRPPKVESLLKQSGIID